MFKNLPNDSKQYLEAELKKLGLNIENIDLILSYCDYILETNKQINLTRIKPEDFIALQVIDSLIGLKAIDDHKPKAGNKLLDIGTGGGFPGVILGLARPDILVTVIDGTGKKIKVIQDWLEENNIKNITAVHARAEEYAKVMENANAFDFITAKAVSNLKELIPLVVPLLLQGGCAVLYKGPDAEQEIADAKYVIRKYDIYLKILDNFTISAGGNTVVRKVILLTK